MRLSPREQESLLVHQCGFLAQKRLARGLRLNHPEAVALLASQVKLMRIDTLGSIISAYLYIINEEPRYNDSVCPLTFCRKKDFAAIKNSDMYQYDRR